MHQATFEEILGPVGEFSALLGRQPVVRRQALRLAPTALLTVCDLDRLLRSRAIRAADLRLATESQIITPVEYTATAEASGGVTAEYAVAERVYRYFDAGATLIWPHLQRFQRPLFELARDVATTVGSACWVDGCLTPAGRMELAVHDRPVEIAVVQLAGTRRWRVWSTVQQHSDRFNVPDVDTLGEPAVDTTLEPGDVLYLPSHSPYVGLYGGNLSLHVSVSFRQPTWRNLLQDTVAELMLDADFLDRPVLPAGADHQRDLAVRRDALVKLLTALDPEQEAHRLRQAAAERADPLLGVLPGTASSGEAGHFATLADADRLSLDDMVEVSPACTLGDAEAAVGMAVYRLPGGLTDALRRGRQSSGESLRAGTLLDGLTGDPIRLARALVRMGVLRRATATASADPGPEHGRG